WPTTEGDQWASALCMFLRLGFFRNQVFRNYPEL
ncbi:MAG: hypothetical protein ACJARP_003299, partial [Vicingaceae bacterium]